MRKERQARATTTGGRAARAVRAAWPWLLILAIALPAAGLAQSSRSERRKISRLKETVDVRMVQVVLSVIDEDQSEFASVRGIPRDDFIIKLDGKPLTPQQEARTVIDELCGETVAPPEVRQALGRDVPDRPLIMLVDFNYLDARGRFNVARALREAADTAEDGQVEFKIYGYTRDLEILTPTKGFVKDRDELLVAAERIETTAYTRRRATGEAEFTIEGPDVGSDSSGLGSASSTASQDTATEMAGLDDVGTTEIREQASGNSMFDEIGPERDFNPSASLGAIERIMVIHGTIPWLKTIMLFSSEAFGYADPQREENELQALLGERKGFKIWPVIAEGLTPGFDPTVGGSRILTSLAGNTGGRATRRTGNLHQAIEGAAEQLSCYYLVSVPVYVEDEDDEYKLTVQLDREGKDRETELKYFRYDLQWDRKTITFADPVAEQRELRLAALFSPDDFPRPPLTVTIDYPTGRTEAEPEAAEETGRRRKSRRERRDAKAIAELAVRFRVRLADLEWSEVDDGLIRARPLYEARFVPALVVERYDGWGTEVLCEFDVDLEGRYRTAEISIPFDGGRPREDDPLALSLEYACPIGKLREGLYVARGIVTDVGSDRIAAGRSAVYLHEPDEERWAVLSPRIETVTSREILWSAASRTVTWDRKKEETWRELSPDDAARIDDRLALRYVLCGPEGEDPSQHVEHVLFRQQEGGAKLEYFLGRGLLDLGEAARDGRTALCPRAEVVLEPYTFTDAGTYVIVAVRSDVDKSALLETVSETPLARLGDAEGVLAAVPFTLTN